MYGRIVHIVFIITFSKSPLWVQAFAQHCWDLALCQLHINFARRSLCVYVVHAIIDSTSSGAASGMLCVMVASQQERLSPAGWRPIETYFLSMIPLILMLSVRSPVYSSSSATLMHIWLMSCRPQPQRLCCPTSALCTCNPSNI